MAIVIDGKEYDEGKLSPELQNYIVVRQEIQTSKVRHLVLTQSLDRIRATFHL